LVATGVAVASLTAAPSAAQERAAPFETIGVSVSLVANVNRNAFHATWRSGAGAELGLASPFYAGTVELGIDQAGFESRTPGVPDFRSRFIFLGWHAGVASRSLRWSAGGRLGPYTMRFDDSSLPDYRRHENELGTELVSRLGWRPAAPWELAFSARYRTVLTEPRLRHVNLAFTATRDFRTPRWLRDFLD